MDRIIKWSYYIIGQTKVGRIFLKPECWLVDSCSHWETFLVSLLRQLKPKHCNPGECKGLRHIGKRTLDVLLVIKPFRKPALEFWDLFEPKHWMLSQGVFFLGNESINCTISALNSKICFQEKLQSWNSRAVVDGSPYMKINFSHTKQNIFSTICKTKNLHAYIKTDNVNSSESWLIQPKVAP